MLTPTHTWADLSGRTDWITTYSGHPFFPLDPKPVDVRIADIAHALAHLCRFAGHTRRFYSVAQHSVIVSRCVAPELALWALLHDASEAYLCDITSPVKRSSSLSGYRDIERPVQAAICQAFNLPIDEPPLVKAADRLVLHTEQRDLMSMPDGWSQPNTLPFVIVPLDARSAEQQFIVAGGSVEQPVATRITPW